MAGCRTARGYGCSGNRCSIFHPWKIERYAEFLRKQSFEADILSGAKISEFPGAPVPAYRPATSEREISRSSTWKIWIWDGEHCE
jgi:hypothetical protein